MFHSIRTNAGEEFKLRLFLKHKESLVLKKTLFTVFYYYLQDFAKSGRPQSQQWNHQKYVRNLIKISNKDTRTTSLNNFQILQSPGDNSKKL